MVPTVRARRAVPTELGQSWEVVVICAAVSHEHTSHGAIESLHALQCAFNHAYHDTHTVRNRRQDAKTYSGCRTEKQAE